MNEFTKTESWKYTAKDGDVVVGTLQEIGEQLIHWHGANRLTDNQEPWIELDDYGSDSPREFTVKEWIDWAVKFEDRARLDVYMSLE